MNKEPVFVELMKNPTYGFHIQLVKILGIDKDVVQIHNDKNVKLFSKYLGDAPLNTG